MAPEQLIWHSVPLKVYPLAQVGPTQLFQEAPVHLVQAALQVGQVVPDKYLPSPQDRQLEEVPPVQVKQFPWQFVQVFTSALNWLEAQLVHEPALGWLAWILAESVQVMH